jgi:hypothetical protein
MMIAVYVLIYALAIAASIRIAIAGLILTSDRVSVRTFFRTRHWAWEEILHFELRPKGRPRLQLKPRDGDSVGVFGFYTGSRKEQARAVELLAALERRREAEACLRR